MIKTKVIRIFILLIILTLVFYKSGLWKNFVKSATAETIGDLSVDWGVPLDEPLFKIFNMLPGDMVTRKVKVMNNAGLARVISIKGIKTSETGNISNKLKLTVTNNGNHLFGPKNLNVFFDDSSGISGIPLTVLAPNATAEYQFKVVFDASAGNKFQDKSVIFTIQFGIAAEVPETCKNINFSKVIFGTEKGDLLIGTNSNDLIFGFEGNDFIYAGLGNDCLVGSTGHDFIFGGPGNDVIYGDEGNDVLDGGWGDDQIFGGPGKDWVNGSFGKDKCEGEIKISCEL